MMEEEECHQTELEEMKTTRKEVSGQNLEET